MLLEVVLIFNGLKIMFGYLLYVCDIDKIWGLVEFICCNIVCILIYCLFYLFKRVIN